MASGWSECDVAGGRGAGGVNGGRCGAGREVARVFIEGATGCQVGMQYDIRAE